MTWLKNFTGKLKRSYPLSLKARPLVPLAAFLLLALVFLDFFHLWPFRSAPELHLKLGDTAVFEGTLIEPAEVTPNGARGVVRLDGSDIKVLLTLKEIPPWERGDRIRFESRLKRPAHYQNPGGFDYRRFLERKGIYLTGFLERPAELLEKNATAWNLMVDIDRMRDSIVNVLREQVAEPAAGFLSLLIVGDRSGMTEELWDNFQKSGTVHLLSISGQHIGIIAAAFFGLFFWILRRSERLLLTVSVRKIAGLLTLIPIFFYTLLAGAPPSAVRAAILALFLFSAPLIGRAVDPVSAMAAGAIVICLLSPSAPFSPSFQLSFLAVLGILLFRKTGRTESRGFSKKYLIDPLWMGLGALLMTAPLVGLSFHQVSFSGLLTNLWAIPAVGAILLLTSFSLISFFLFPFRQHFLGTLFLSFCGKLSHWFLYGIESSARHSWVLSFYPTGWEVFLSYLLIAALIFMRRKPNLWKPAALGGVIILLVLLIPRLGLFEKNLEATFLDVGQGDSALIQTPSGKSLLIDGGGFLIPGINRAHFDIGNEVLVPYLRRLGLRRIDRILLSHPHPDHYGGLQAVFENFPVGEFWWNGQKFPDETFDRLLETVGDKKVPSKILKAGDQIDWEGLKIQILYPSEISPARNINDNSLVVRISCATKEGEVSFLFPGDIEKDGERALSDSGLIQATILKIPHHGSKTSSSVPFIDSVFRKEGPRFAVASLGDGNLFGFPHPGILEKYERRGVEVYRTDKNGAVTFIVPRDFPKKRISIQTVSSKE